MYLHNYMDALKFYIITFKCSIPALPHAQYSIQKIMEKISFTYILPPLPPLKILGASTFQMSHQIIFQLWYGLPSFVLLFFPYKVVIPCLFISHKFNFGDAQVGCWRRVDKYRHTPKSDPSHSSCSALISWIIPFTSHPQLVTY